ncbi:hypothetical protein PINS_up005992 [Pythium insidiosum]|nr:hypothetical protein PINS_up005992 [Pythium insidiosum]
MYEGRLMTLRCDGRTPLHLAASAGQVHVLEVLLKRNAKIEAQDRDGRTPLHVAARAGQENVVKVLLKRKAHIEAQDTDGWTPLHLAACSGEMDIVRCLLYNNASVDTHDISQATPLDKAVRNGHDAVALLLAKCGADFNVKDQAYDLYRPVLLHVIVFLLENEGSTSSRNGEHVFERLLRHSLHFVLSSAFASVQGRLMEEVSLWRQLNKLSSKIEAVNVIQRCLDFWHQQSTDGTELTEIPEEVANEGTASVEMYISALTKSSSSTYRHKICVVGPTTAGKTSLIKSLTRGESTLEEIDTRTVGIDLFSHHFESDGKQHEVTFWDFAGHDVYHAAHTVFFSRRTLFLLAVDLAKYASVLPHANERAQIAEAKTKRFVDEHVFHWLRLILTRLPEATIAFIGTKTDLVGDDVVDEIHADLEGQIASWCDGQSALQKEQEQARKTNRHSGSWLDMRKKLTVAVQGWLAVSSTDVNSIQMATKRLERLVVSQRRGFLMPDTYSSVLESIQKRREAHGSSLAAQVKQMFAKKEEALKWLVQELPTLRKQGCELVMRTLHELGDVLWYDVSVVAGKLKDQTCLAPDLVINLVRELISHELFELMNSTDGSSTSLSLTSRQMAYEAISGHVVSKCGRKSSRVVAASMAS